MCFNRHSGLGEIFDQKQSISKPLVHIHTLKILIYPKLYINIIKYVT